MKPVWYIGQEYPARSQTFVWNEFIHLVEVIDREARFVALTGLADCRESTVALGEAGKRVSVISLRVADLVDAVLALISYWRSLPRLIRTIRRRWAGRWRSDWRGAIYTVYCASLISRQTDGPVHFHAHFVGRTLDVAAVSSVLVQGSFSVTAHAGDATRRSTRELSKLLAGASFVACASDYVQASVVACDGKFAVRTVHCGVEIPLVSPDLTTSRIRSVVSIARFVEKKGLDVLLRAFAELSPDFPALTLVLIGDGPDAQSLRELAARLNVSDHTRFLGFLPSDAVRGVLQARDALFVLPSRVAGDGDVDGIPVAIMEALAFGLPVVSTAVGGISELVVHGVSGLVVEPDNVEQLHTSMRRLLTDAALRELVGAGGRSLVMSAFNSSVEVLKMKALFDEFGGF